MNLPPSLLERILKQVEMNRDFIEIESRRVKHIAYEALEENTQVTDEILKLLQSS